MLHNTLLVPHVLETESAVALPSSTHSRDHHMQSRERMLNESQAGQKCAGCPILGISGSRSVTHRGFIMIWLNWMSTALWKPMVYLPGVKAVLVFPLPPDRSPPTRLPWPKPHVGTRLAENNHTVTCLPPASGNWEFTGIEGTGGSSHELHSWYRNLSSSWYFRVSYMLFSFPEINLYGKKKKREKNPQSFRGIRNQFQEALSSLMVNAATESKCILLCVCTGLIFLLSFIQKQRRKTAGCYVTHCWNTTVLFIADLSGVEWFSVWSMRKQEAWTRWDAFSSPDTWDPSLAAVDGYGEWNRTVRK